MKSYAFVTGRNPELSLEELLVVLAPLGHVSAVHRDFLIFKGEIDCSEILSRLGGTIKVAELFYSMDNWREFNFEMWLTALRQELTQETKRFNFGLSVYSANGSLRRQLVVLGIKLKQHIRSLPMPARFVVNNEAMLSSVVVRKNKLLNRELIVLEGDRYHFGITRDVQDFDSYGLRDYGRPSRNAKRGMLPPKVAQIMLNLARINTASEILDPFCGVGTVLQEALLRGVTGVWGSDKDPVAVREAEHNAKWLAETYNTKQPKIGIVDVQYLSRHYGKHQFDAVVTEPYLGPSRLLIQASLTRAALAEVQREVTDLIERFFRELSLVVKPRGRAVVIFPAYRLFDREYSVGNIESIERSGWHREPPQVSMYLKDAKFSERGFLLYSRPGQVVSREVTVWIKAN